MSSATLLPMAAARIATIALATLPAAVLTQTPPPTSVVEIHIMDGSGAVIPGATVRATSVVTGAVVSVRADANGAAALNLPAGNYTASISATGFKVFEGQFSAPDEPGKWFDVKLGVAPTDPCTLCGSFDFPTLPVEHTDLTAFIPLLQPQTLLVLPARPVHRRFHWL